MNTAISPGESADQDQEVVPLAVMPGLGLPAVFGWSAGVFAASPWPSRLSPAIARAQSDMNTIRHSNLAAIRL